MNINLIYEGKNYNFDVPNNVTVDYLKELSSKIFNSEKELLDLIYKDKKITDNDDNFLVRDLIPEGETNAILTVQKNKNINNISLNKVKKKKKERKISHENLKEKDSYEIEENNRYDNTNEKKIKKIKKYIIDNVNDENNNIISNHKKNNEKNLIENLYNANIYNKNRLMLINNMNNSNNITDKFNFKIMTKKEKFNSDYIQKNGELLTLMRQFSEKIKKIYLILYNKYRISNRNLSNNISTISNIKTTRNDQINFNLMDNSFYELALYEKKIMNYLEIQIQHYKTLLKTMQTYDNNINFTNLSDFYHKLFIFIPEETFSNKSNKNKIVNQKKESNNKTNKKLVSNNSSINLTSINTSNPNIKLPSIKMKNYKSSIIKETFLNERKLIQNLNPINNINNNISTQKELNKEKENKLQKNIISRNTNLEEDDIFSSNNNTNKNNILDNISEKNSVESNEELKDKIKNDDITPIQLRKKNTSNIIKKSETINNNITPLKEIKLNKRKESVITSFNKMKNTFEKKVNIDLESNINTNTNKKDKRVKEINVSAINIKDYNNFSLEKNPLGQNTSNPDIKFDYVM